MYLPAVHIELACSDLIWPAYCQLHPSTHTPTAVIKATQTYKNTKISIQREPESFTEKWRSGLQEILRRLTFTEQDRLLTRMLGGPMDKQLMVIGEVAKGMIERKEMGSRDLSVLAEAFGILHKGKAVSYTHLTLPTKRIV